LLNLINNIACDLLPEFYIDYKAYSFLQCTPNNFTPEAEEQMFYLIFI